MAHTPVYSEKLRGVRLRLGRSVKEAARIASMDEVSFAATGRVGYGSTSEIRMKTEAFLAVTVQPLPAGFQATPGSSTAGALLGNVAFDPLRTFG